MAQTQLTPERLATVEKLSSILFPFATRGRERMMKNHGRFVHYTSAENALKIINTKRVWMRNTTCMSDYREVNHGLDALNRYLNRDNHQQALTAALNECSAGLADEAFASFNKNWQGTQLQTFITSISEHDDREDFHGRLSMWRAFGNSAARVAMVLNIDLDYGKNIALGAELSPVAYLTDTGFGEEFDLVISNIRQSKEFLRDVDRQWLLNVVISMLTSAAVCLKHEGFNEEREWRVIYSPQRFVSPVIETAIEVVTGVPQRVYKIPLENNPSAGLSGLEPDELINRIIIGPTQFSWAMFEAFTAALTAAGVRNAGERVFFSQIPVRT
jgi:hypothetical protein